MDPQRLRQDNPAVVSAPASRLSRGHVGGRAIACLIRNQSETGAALEVVSPVPAQFTLLIAADSIRYGCMAIWRTEKLIGVKFHELPKLIA